MKIRTSIYILLVALSLHHAELASAQRQINFGGRLGLNLANMFGDTYGGLTFKPGILVGLYATLPHNEKWDFQGGLQYSQTGARNYNFDFSQFSDVIYDQKLRYNYLNIPVLAKYKLKEKWGVHGGAQVGVLLAAKEVRVIKSGTPAPTDNSAGTRSFYQRIKPVYFTLLIGAEYQLKEHLGAQVRIISSPFDNVRKNAGDSEGTFPLIFQLTVAHSLSHLLK